MALLHLSIKLHWPEHRASPLCGLSCSTESIALGGACSRLREGLGSRCLGGPSKFSPQRSHSLPPGFKGGQGLSVARSITLNRVEETSEKGGKHLPNKSEGESKPKFSLCGN